MSRKIRQRDGSVLILFLLILPVLILVVGFSIDFAHVQRVRTELRRSTDLAAKAAAQTLSETESEDDARATAQSIAAQNFVGGQPLSLPDGAIDFGNAYRGGDGSWVYSSGAVPINAVQILGSRNATAPDGRISSYFGVLYGNSHFDAEASAIAAFIDSDICLVLDRSSSMKLAESSTDALMSSGDPRFCQVPWADSRWVALDNAVDVFLDEMTRTRAREKFAVVTFSSNSNFCGENSNKVDVDQPLSFSETDVQAALNARSTSIWGGMTDIAAGIEKGHEILTGAGSRPTAQRIMIVLTDGQYTEDNPVPYAFSAASDGIMIYTITFSAGAAQSDMINVAAAGNGRHYHANNAAELDVVFREVGGAISKLVQ